MQEVCDRLGPSLTSSRFWVTNRHVINQGVFASVKGFYDHKQHVKVMQDKIHRVADIRNNKTLMFHATFERDHQTRTNMRAGLLVASFTVLCKFIASLVQTPAVITGYNFQYQGMYWQGWSPEPIYPHPYIDVDVMGMPGGEDMFSDVFKYVVVAVDKINERIMTLTGRAVRPRVVVFYNCREMSKRNGVSSYKHSFHVHWPEFVFPSMLSLAGFIREINQACPKMPVMVDNKLVEGESSLLDTGVYAAVDQLFRIPYSGKKNQMGCRLLPIRTDKMNDVWTFSFIDGNEENFIRDSCTYTVFKEDFIEVVVEQPEVHAIPTRRAMPTHGVVAVADEDAYFRRSWLDFWEPIIKHILMPNWFESRRTLAQKLNVRVLIPKSDSTTFQRFDQLTGYEASYRISVAGDNFCEYDTRSTPYTHQGASNSISYVVDCYNGKIAQQCWKCRPPHLKWYRFIQDGMLTFKVMEGVQADRECASVVFMKGKKADFFDFFLKFFKDVIVYCKEMAKMLVYDEVSGIWLAGIEGNRLLVALVSRLNKTYMRYMTQRNSQVCDKNISQWEEQNVGAPEADRDEAVEKFTVACREANGKIAQLYPMTLPQESTLATNLRGRSFANTQPVMEKFPHLIPLKNKQCLDVFLWEVSEIKPEYYFTSIVNANIIDLREPSVQDFQAWQLQVCCGDHEYFNWKMQVMGLSLTLMNFDRAFYMPLGPVGRNGKSSENFLFNEALMSTVPHRGYNLSREYLTKISQDRKGANAADTVLMDINNKTVVIADECRDTPLDGALIKSMVSGDKTNARNLYESERTTVSSYFSLWIIANKTVKLDYGDTALMNRARIMPYNAQWVTDVAATRKKLDPFAAQWVFQDDPYFKEKTLKLWVDAFATRSLYALHCFLKRLPKDPQNPGQPIKLEAFEVPEAVRKLTSEKIQREHPILGFINNHLGLTNRQATFIPVDEAFKQFRQYGRNDNSSKVRFIAKPRFVEDLTRELVDFVDLDRDGTTVRCLKGYYLKKEVPGVELVDVAPVGSSYVPPPVKRRREDDEVEMKELDLD